MVETRLSYTNGNSAVSAKRYAVVVGVNDYSGTGYGDLSFCAADAEAFYEALLNYCEYDPAHVRLFSDGSHKNAEKPHRSNILAAVASMARSANKEDSVLFFFAGHGTRDANDSYLLTHEFIPSVVADTGIPMEMINNYLKQSEGRLVMRFFDACHSGRLGARTAAVGPDIQRHFLIEGEGFATLSACKVDEPAHESSKLGHGIFSYCLVKGLSGEATTGDGVVTLSSLSAYTTSKTVEITRELGLQQTPVNNMGIAGDQVLATIRAARPAHTPQVLVKVEETSIDDLKPTSEKIPQFVTDLRSILQDDPLQTDFIAPSQDEKLLLGKKLTEKVFQWCEGQEQQYRDPLHDIVTVKVERKSIRICPLNLQLAEFVDKLDFKQSMALRLLYRSEQVSSNNLWQVAIMNYTTRQVLEGVTESPGCYETAVMLTIQSQNPVMPVCAMVVAIIPSSFGLYLLRYSCSTQLNLAQAESWNSGTFSVRTLQAIPFTDTEGEQTLKMLEDLYPQLVSLFIESCQARRNHLKRIGATGQPLV